MLFDDHQVLDTRLLREQGLSQRAVERLVNKGRLHRVENGVFTTSPPTGRLLLRALLHRRPYLIFTGRTALELRRDAPITLPVQAVVSPTRSVHNSTWITLRRRSTVGTEMVEGFTVTVAAVAVAHADGLSDEELIAFLEGEFSGHRGKTRLAAEVATMRRVPSSFHSLVARAAIGADSEAERAVVRALVARGVVGEQNAFLGHYHFDILIPHAKLIVEIDGYSFHSAENRETFVQDRWKANYAIRHGYRVLRYSGSCVKHHLELVVEQILAAVEGAGTLGSESVPVWAWHHMHTRDAPWPDEVAQ